MHRFIFADASTSSDSAERPASVASGSASSAEQPATLPPSAAQPGTPSYSKTLSIRDVQCWLAEEPIVSCNSAGAQRVREAVAVLSQPQPRQKDVRRLQNQWHVAQKKNKQTRPLADVIQEFQDKVINAAKKLQQQLSESAAPPAPQLDAPQAASDWQVLRECNDWLQTLPSQEISKSKPLQRLQTALTLLQSHSSRHQRQDVQQLLGHWNVPQKTYGRKRKYDEVQAHLVAKLVEETHRLQRMQDVAKAARPDDAASSAGGRFSDIQAALQRASVQTKT